MQSVMARIKNDKNLDPRKEMKKLESLDIPVSERLDGGSNVTMYDYALYRHEEGKNKLKACLEDGSISEDIDVGINDSKHKCHVSDFLKLAADSGLQYEIVHLVPCRSLRDRELALGGHPGDDET